MTWERLQAPTNNRTGTWVVLNQAGIARLSADAVEALGSPERVRLMLDRERRRFGFKADDGPGSYRASKGTFSVRPIARELDIPRDARLPAHMEGDILVVPLPTGGA